MISVRRWSPNFSFSSSSSPMMIFRISASLPRISLSRAMKLEDLLVLLDDLVALQAGQAVEPHLEDRLRLQFG